MKKRKEMSLVRLAQISFIFGMLLLTGSGCAPLATKPALQLTPVSDSTKPIELQGFSILPPNGENWFIVDPKNRLSRYSIDKYGATFFKTPSRESVLHPGESHTIVAQASTLFADLQLITSTAVLEDVIEGMNKEKTKGEGGRFKVLEAKTFADNSQGYDCVKYDMQIEDSGVPKLPGEIFILDVHGHACLHPDYYRYVIVMEYSQRYRKGSQSFTLEAEGESFLRGLKFSKLEKPYVVASIPLGNSPQEVVIGHGSIWVAHGDNTVSRIDPMTNKVIKIITVGNDPIGVAADEKTVWVTNGADDTVSRIDPATDSVVATIPVGRKPLFLTAGADAIWVANSGDGTVSRIDPNTNRVIASIKVSKLISDVSDVKVSGDAIWVANFRANTVSKIDPGTNTVVATIRAGRGAHCLMVDDDTVWVGNQWDGTISLIDAKSNTIKDEIYTGQKPSGLAAINGTIWVTNWDDDTVVRIDSRTNQTVGRPIPVGRRPLRVTGDDKTIWVTNAWGQSIMRIEQ